MYLKEYGIEQKFKTNLSLKEVQRLESIKNIKEH